MGKRAFFAAVSASVSAYRIHPNTAKTERLEYKVGETKCVMCLDTTSPPTSHIFSFFNVSHTCLYLCIEIKY